MAPPRDVELRACSKLARDLTAFSLPDNFIDFSCFVHSSVGTALLQTTVAAYRQAESNKPNIRESL